ncbi:MAG: 2-succinyl-5-enolpyruvyl-6-hydroxy-3-cyclohexene-1-carboxylate synthase, partial [Synechococcaceae cyanobacterium]|nr:2-succinyl-5-enolpyruvyl-6-hydroxy-3-cyclohexene-1-carboxylate synthase [Synechococcaceae cyanobacterium]
KDCGANQSVNQAQFLRASCRWVGEGPPEGLDRLDPDAIRALAERAMDCSLGGEGPDDEGRDEGTWRPAGPVHLNLPFEEPLHIGPQPLARLRLAAEAPLLAQPAALTTAPPASPQVSCLDPDRPGVVVAGPWRGSARHWPLFLAALQRWQRRSGWPLLADALSGLRGHDLEGLISAYDLLLVSPDADLAVDQVLRLGPLPASRRLQEWLLGLSAVQEQVCEGDGRRQDPLGRVQRRWGGGLHSWLNGWGDRLEGGGASPRCRALGRRWHEREQVLQQGLEAWLAQSPDSEPALARQLSRLLPPGLPLMLANSSPVRDWESFSDPAAQPRPLFSFRGASGIDGTLSEACGLAEALGSLLLVCGDLALLHDSNGWLLTRQLRGRLTLMVIDNGGGGIFEQLPIRTDPDTPLDFERLFAMPQSVDPLALAACHGAEVRRLAGTADLAGALAWALERPLAVLLLHTDRRSDAALRRQLRTMAADLRCSP